MTPRYPPALAWSERVLGGLTVLNVIYGAGLLLLFLGSLDAPWAGWVPLLGTLADAARDALPWMQTLMLVGLAAVPVAHVILARLRAMLATVRAGDPFVVENARRLHAIALAVLALECLHLLVGAIAKGDAFARLGVHVDWAFSFTPWVAVLLLSVLARVFEHGARMRADLDGTV